MAASSLRAAAWPGHSRAGTRLHRLVDHQTGCASSWPSAWRAAPLSANKDDACEKSAHLRRARLALECGRPQAMTVGSSISAGSASTAPTSAGPRSVVAMTPPELPEPATSSRPRALSPRSRAHCRDARTLSCSRSKRASQTPRSDPNRRGRLLGQRQAPGQVPVPQRWHLTRALTCCRPYCRTVSSSPYRAPIDPLHVQQRARQQLVEHAQHRLLAIPSHAQTISAAATSQPPTNTASRRSIVCAAESSSP